MDSVNTVGDWSLQYTPPPSEWFYSHNASAILCPSAKGGERTILDMRGWGYLTGKGHGALGLDSETAAREQDALALFIIDACKAAASPAGAEVVARPPCPEGDVIGPCVCGSWPGGPCLKCEWRVPATPTPSTDAVRRQAREALLSEILRIIDSEEGAALVLRDMARNHQDREAAVIRGAEAAAIANLRPRIRALSTPPAGAAALNEGDE